MWHFNLQYHRRDIAHHHQGTLKRGETVWLYGDSGIGKSSLLNSMAGLTRVDLSSSFTHEQQDLLSLSPQDRPLVLMPQGDSLLGHLRLWENVALADLKRPWFGAELRQAAHILLEKMGLSDQADTFPAEISGGQAQRTILARSLLQVARQNRRLLLLDEPSSALDQQNTQRIIAVIAEHQKQFGVSILWASHQPLISDRAFQMLADKASGRVCLIETKNGATDS